MGSCLLIGAVAVTLSGDRFTLETTAAPERHEEWIINAEGLRLLRTRLRGAGAEDQAGPNAVLHDGWWTWRPNLPPVPELVLSHSAGAPSVWRFCDGGDCRDLAPAPDKAITIRPCR
ncbi:MAG: DUF1850 domain-containing protein [Paracoccus sp. (in: a-proteobacteria)]|nr:DUF1850 domain-containing protein [Paracoccus sp. (in: a-proteobacteria)]